MLALLVALAFRVAAADAVVRHPKDFEWKVSGTLPQAAASHSYHLIREDPKTGGVLARVRMSKGYAMPSHSHSTDETIVLVSGKLELTVGGKAQTLGEGSYAVIPAGTPHSLKTGGCEFLVSFAGPMDIKPE